jgi:hypothetical protein
VPSLWEEIKVGKRKMRKPSPSVPTAREIVGGPGLMPRRKYRLREAELQRAVVDAFAGAGRLVWSQVDCGFAGVADVVTEDEVYELKDWVTRRTLYQAIGQVKGYSTYLSRLLERVLRPYIICNGTSLSTRKREKFEDLHGVPIIIWGDPPWVRAQRT